MERGNKRPIKRKLFSDFIVDMQTQKPKRTVRNEVKKLKKGKENNAPEVIDSQEAGPSSNRRKEWLTFYPSDTDDSSIDDDNAKCIICHLTSPPEFERQIRVERRVQFLKWGKCNSCHGWVHLRYCSPV